MRIGRLPRVLALILTVALLATVSVPMPVRAAGAKQLAKLTNVAGDVFVTRSGGAREFSAYGDMPVFQGDWLRTGDNGSVTIAYANGTETTLGSDSDLTFEKLAGSGGSTQTVLKLWSGSIWNKIKSLLNIDDQYEVETPTSVMGVRGTLYLVSVDKGSGTTTSHVLDGLVSVRQNNDPAVGGQERLVEMGQVMQVSSPQGSLPEKQAIDNQSFVQTVEPRMIVHVLNDVTGRVNELLDKAKQAQNGYGQTKDVGFIKNALVLVQKSQDLATFAGEFINTVQKSDKSTAVEQILTQSNQTLEQVQSQINHVQQESQQTQSSVMSAAQNAGLSTDEIKDILIQAPTTPAPAEQSPASVPTDNGSSSSDYSPVLVTSLNVTKLGHALTAQDVDFLRLGENPYAFYDVKVLPVNASNQKLAWSTSDPNVAAVDQTGKVIPIGLGTAVITVAAQDGSPVKASFQVTVQLPTQPGTLSMDPNSGQSGMSTGLKLRYTAGENFTGGTVWFALPQGFSASPSDLVIIKGGSAVTLSSLSTQASIYPEGVSLSGLNLNRGETVEIKLNNQVVPGAGAYTFFANADADGSGQEVASLGVHRESVIFWSAGEFAQGQGYATGAYALAAAQPTAFNWTRQSRFAGPDFPKVKWSALIPATDPSQQGIGSSPVMGADGTVYFGARNGNLYAFNPDGSQKWKFPTGGGIDSSPAIAADGTIYVGSSDYNLYAVNPDGSQKWVFATQGEVSSPAIGPDGTVYVGSGDKKLYALDPNATDPLRKKWEYLTGGTISATPAVAADGTIYVESMDGNLYALKNDGSGPMWVVNTGDSFFMSAPVIGPGGDIYAGTVSGRLLAYDPNGQKKWEFHTVDGYPYPAVARDGTIYVASRANPGTVDNPLTTPAKVYALNSDGTEKWEYSEDGPTALSFHSTPLVDAYGTVYLASDNGYLYAIDQNGSFMGKLALSGVTYSSPALAADGTLYAGTSDGYLYAVSSASPKITDVMAVDQNNDSVLDAVYGQPPDGLLISFDRDLDPLSQNDLATELLNNPALGSNSHLSWNNARTVSIALGEGFTLGLGDTFSLNGGDVFDTYFAHPWHDLMVTIPFQFSPLLRLANGDGITYLNAPAPSGPPAGTSVDQNVLTFKLTAEQEDIAIAAGDSIRMDMDQISGLQAGDFSNIELYQDTNGDGIPDGSPVATGSLGSIVNGAGTINFNVYLPQTINKNQSMNYILQMDLTNWSINASFNFDDTRSIHAIGQGLVTGMPVVNAGNISGQHFGVIVP